MRRDPIREKIRRELHDRDITMREASIAIGRNPAYLHQFLERGSPRVLSAHDSRALAAILECDADELRRRDVPRRRPATRKARPPTAAEPRAPLAAIPEMAVDAAAGGGALNEDHATEKARWYIPEAMIRHEADADPESVRILRARGDSMEPVVNDGDRLVVDTERRTPATGEMAVLWDGKRTRRQTRRNPPRRRTARNPPPIRKLRIPPIHMPRRRNPHRRNRLVDHPESAIAAVEIGGAHPHRKAALTFHASRRIRVRAIASASIPIRAGWRFVSLASRDAPSVGLSRRSGIETDTGYDQIAQEK